MTVLGFSAALLMGLATAGATFAGSEWEAALKRIESAPVGLPDVPIPVATLMTAEQIALGRQLFFDARLSADGVMSCATCHKPDQAFTQTSRATPLGASGKPLPRNAPTLINVAYTKLLMQDGEAHSLEAQVLAPLFSPDEMANPSIAGFVARVAALPDYAGRFEAAFGERATISNLATAVASYERTLVSGNSPFDRWYYAGVADALSPPAQAGFKLFTGKARCQACHTIDSDHALLTDQAFHNTGRGTLGAGQRAHEQPVDIGREAVTHDPGDRFNYRTPSLRNVAKTPPYMHDGSLPSLEAVIEFYNAGGAANPGLDPLLRPLGLDDGEIAALVAFLESLTGDNLTVLEHEGR